MTKEELNKTKFLTVNQFVVKVCRPSNDNGKEIVFKLCGQQAKTLITLIEAKEKGITFLSISLLALRLVIYILRIEYLIF